jgi:2-C-methyl-D-erythritol 4-phosphate cytidylyltransferase/2-C-methyl-D-erythritol 2,4-cyclodiphosphate synthase
MSDAVAIIVAGGLGTRAGADRPKQWALLNGKRVIDWSIDTFCSHSGISQLIVTASSELGEPRIGQKYLRAEPGSTRNQSVRSGLRLIEGTAATKVLIHDAARPGLSHAIIDSLLLALDRSDAAAPAIAVTDALRRAEGNELNAISREGLYRIQTPQAFRLKTLLEGLDASSDDLVDDLTAVEKIGAKIAIVPGDLRLQKITHPEDFEMMSRLLPPLRSAPRIGKGYDVHAFEPGDSVTLCGISIPHDAKLQGHSDADAAWHALTDAILGAVALGDIGDHFPPSDLRWRGADSAIFLKEAQRLAFEKGYTLANCDITIICEAPKVKPYREAMRTRTADLLGLPLDAISVKATTTEGLGFTGRREGIAAEAVALLIPKS